MSKNKTTREINLQLSHVKAYQYIDKYIAKKIVAPEMIEVSKYIKLTVRQTYRVVEDLCELGYLSKEPYKKRSIKVLKALR